MPATGDATPEEIRYLLAKIGWTFADVDRAYELTAHTARKASRYPHIAGELALAEALGKSPRELWPSRFTKCGDRLQPQPADNYKPVPRFRQRSKRKAA
ncbi:helix-turn-helix domain-containing protein [Thalassobaculum sp.]|uniref:helix-turn-helix domain-containing protein n=1 Tax=Thalassobaculum sp. TaxID=2022740 RepID=UPI0032EB6836